MALAPRYTLLVGDCLQAMERMADHSIDVVLTDPPYSEHVHGKSKRGAKKAGGASRDLRFKAISVAEIHRVSKAFARLARRWVLVFSDVESTVLWRAGLEAAGLDYVRTGAWIKLGAAPQFTGDRPAAGFECITIAHRKGAKRWNGRGAAAVWSVPIVGGHGCAEPRVHTTQKPLALMETLVRQFSDPGELILDAYAGSGTTGVAALRQGRRFVGCEVSKRTAAAALERLGSTREQLDFFEARA